MKNTIIEKIEKEIDEKTKIPKDVKDKIKKEVITNILVGAGIIIYLIFIFLGSIETVKSVRSIDINIFSILFLGISIFLFEVAYRKDNGKLAMYGIELLAVAIFTLFLPYIIFELDETNKKYYLIASICIAIYYILKSIIISLKIKSKYMNSNISDVKEIVKKEKSKRRIKEEAEEIKTEKNIENSNKLKKSGKTTEKNVNNIDQQQNQSKKRGRPRKEKLAEDIKENEKKETTPKKRGRPKKSEIANNENKANIQVDEHVEAQPKKRGRPRKVVISND